jgi:hypothetical protein
MSSHREAPQISKDPVADSTDLYAFVSPDRPGFVTLIANYIPLEHPAGGPNFYEFGDDVLYELHIDTDGDGDADISYQFRFVVELSTPSSFLYNTGPILSLNSSNWNRRQRYSVTRVTHGYATVLASNLSCPPCNVGPLSTPDYDDLAADAIHPLPGGGWVFAGQRAEGFYVDLGAVFDLADLRPLAAAHATFGLPSLQSGPGVNTTKAVNVHTIALQLPVSQLTANGSTPTSPTDPHAVIGVWTSASRQQADVLASGYGDDVHTGPFVQVSRLGNPLFNEVLVPVSEKDLWNRLPPSADKQFAGGVTHPELAKLLPVLYPGAFPNLAALVASGASRADLVAILLTGIPPGIVSPTFTTFTGATEADLLRLNVAIPATTHGASNLGVIGGDLAGFPNGRRVFDDVVTIELQAVAGATYPLVHPTYKPDMVVSSVTDGLTSGPTDLTAKSTVSYLPHFPYLGTPHSGYLTPSS